MDVKLVATEATESKPDQTNTSAPSVVAVVIARAGGEALTRTVADLTAQDYQNMSVLVLDRSGIEGLKSDLAETAPATFVRSLDQDPGYAGAANLILDMVEGAAFFLLCRDDLAVEPTTVRTLVEEAFRSNAGMVGPKQVHIDRRDELLNVGLGVDKFGYPAPTVDVGEIDQEQHDSVRDVFAIAPGCTLVRADLFATIEGFDTDLDAIAAHIDLCWRCHLAGGRVIIAPEALVAHTGRSLDDQALVLADEQARLHMQLSNYSRGHLARVVPQQLVMTCLLTLGALASGGAGATRSLRAWTSSIGDLGAIRSKRRAIGGYRLLSDGDVRRLQTRGSARLTAFVRSLLGRKEGRASGVAERARHRASASGRGMTTEAWGVLGGLTLLFLFGSRHLLTSSVPAIGEFARFPIEGELLGQSLGGWRTAGLGARGVAPILTLLAGVLSVFGDANGIIRTLLIIGPLPIAAWAAWRLGAAFASRWAPVVSCIVYSLIALPYNALANGEWRALWVYALMPLVASRLARVSTPMAMRSPSLDPRMAPLGLLVGALGLVHPAALLAGLFTALCFVVGGLLARRTTGAVATIGFALIATAIGAVLHLPVLIALADRTIDPSLLLGWQRGGGTGAGVTALARFDTGPVGGSALGWLLLPATALGLVIGRDWRFDWAVRGLVLAYGSLALALAAERDWFPTGLPAEEVLLVPAAVGFAMAAAMGVAAFELDLRDYGFGWRQGLAVAVGLALALGSLPVLGAAFGGRWAMPDGDLNRSLSFIDEEAAASGGFRLLWLGHPDVLPVAGWPLADEGELFYATSLGLPTIAEISVAPEGSSRLLADAVALARGGETRRLGRLLGPLSVRYVVVPSQLAPNPFGGEQRVVDPSIAKALSEQLDMVELPLNSQLRIFRNTAWVPMRAELASGTSEIGAAELGTGGQTDPRSSLDEIARTDLSGSRLVLASQTGSTGSTGSVSEETRVHIAQAFDRRWQLSVDGRPQELTHSFGWATGFKPSQTSDSAVLGYRTPIEVRLLLTAQLLLWLSVIVWAWRTRIVTARTPDEDDFMFDEVPSDRHDLMQQAAVDQQHTTPETA